MVLLGLLVACAPCGELQVDDPTDRLSARVETELAAAHADWLDWTGGPGRVCLDRIVPDGQASSTRLRGRTLMVSPDVEDPTASVRWGLCQALDAAEGHQAARPDLFGADAGSFAQACSFGPQDSRWKEPIRAACGTDGLSELERYLSDHVYVEAPSGRWDGALAATVGETIEPLNGSPVALGARLLWVEAASDRLDLTVHDPATAEEQALYSREGQLRVRAFGGVEGAAVITEDEAGAVLAAIELDGTVREVPLGPLPSLGPGVVAHGALWAPTSDWATGPLARIDLRTGALTAIDLPAPDDGQEVLVSGVQPLADGLWIQTWDASVDLDGGFVDMRIVRHETWRYRPDDDSWTLLADDLYLLDAGVDEEGRVVGSVFSAAGRLLVAYDAETDQLLLSDDVCIEDPTYPTVATGRTVWRWDHSGMEALVLE
jgi:hypothetical protein